MGLFTKDIKTMNDLFVHQLQDIYYAEKQLVKALPKMAKAANAPALKLAFETHLEQTLAQVDRLKAVFGLLGAEAVLGARVTGADQIEVETSEVQRFRRNVAAVARDHGCELDEVVPLDDDLDSVFRYLVGR